MQTTPTRVRPGPTERVKVITVIKSAQLMIDGEKGLAAGCLPNGTVSVDCLATFWECSLPSTSSSVDKLSAAQIPPPVGVLSFVYARDGDALSPENWCRTKTSAKHTYLLFGRP